MTTARERYEAKTKVVTFRVSNEVFDQIEEIKARNGLSNADLVKLGAGIADEEIKKKLAEESGLESRLAQLKAAIRQAQQELDSYIGEEKKRRLAELDAEMEAFKLFDQGWALEEVSFKTGIPLETVYRYFQEWGELRKDKEAIERELLRACLRKHIKALENRQLWLALFPSTPKERLKEIEDEIAYSRYLLNTPSQINQDWRVFLLGEYSPKIQSAKTKRMLGDSA